MKFDYVKDSYAGESIQESSEWNNSVAPEVQASTKFSDITISYKKDKDNYRKGTPQKILILLIYLLKMPKHIIRLKVKNLLVQMYLCKHM